MDDRGVHNLYKQLVSSGHAFGAKRWITTLDRQCERLASAMATNIPTVDVGGINDAFLLFFSKNTLRIMFFVLNTLNIPGERCKAFNYLFLIYKEH